MRRTEQSVIFNGESSQAVPRYKFPIPFSLSWPQCAPHASSSARNWETVISPFVLRSNVFRSCLCARIFTLPIAPARDFRADRIKTHSRSVAHDHVKAKITRSGRRYFHAVFSTTSATMVFTSWMCVLAMRFKRLRNSDLPAGKSSNLISLL